jgi:putative endonuclease
MLGWLARLLGRLTSSKAGRPRETASPNDRLGPRSEQLAREFLERAGFRIIAANYRCPVGELDLVARGEGKLVFVEVKARRLHSPLPLGKGAGVRADAAPPARPEHAVHRRKQKKIGRAARYFCRAHRCQDEQVRFDVIAIDWPGCPADGEPVIRHHKAAFRPDV